MGLLSYRDQRDATKCNLDAYMRLLLVDHVPGCVDV